MWRPAFTSLQISISTIAHVKIMAVRVVRVECKLSISTAVCTRFHEWSRSSHHFKKSIQQNEPSLKCLQEKRISSTFHSMKLWLHWSNAHLSLKTSTSHEWCCYIFRFHFQRPTEKYPTFVLSVYHVLLYFAREFQWNETNSVYITIYVSSFCFQVKCCSEFYLFFYYQIIITVRQNANSGKNRRN